MKNSKKFTDAIEIRLNEEQSKKEPSLIGVTGDGFSIHDNELNYIYI